MVSAERLYAATDATWPPAAIFDRAGWRLRRGEGGGHRVSAASALAAEAADRVAEAEAAMRGFGQTPLFQMREGEEALDALLDAHGYRVIEPVVLLAAPAETLAAHDPKGYRAIRCDRPLARMRVIWGEGGVGAPRLTVMARAKGPKAYLLGRADDRAAGVCFVAVDGEVAMLHALHVLGAARGRGVGRALTAAAASFAAEAGAGLLALAVTVANGPARRLYEGLGFAPVGRYHYRALPD
ncbi:MAG TPA: GNAT family N-acetyltransferase [Paracoccaceae bacterium]|nr:GNAT family N-acetyltransferase [Paracoccaceae bacterium]